VGIRLKIHKIKLKYKGGIQMKLINLMKHLNTITKHKWYVFCACKDIRLYWRGITHDMSKYTPIELFSSAQYFQGTKSPIDVEKTAKGYSLAWQHHKRKNSHHWEYWIDFKDGQVITLKIPYKDVLELICDWIGAGKAYNTSDWNQKVPYEYWMKNKHKYKLHPETEVFINQILVDINHFGWKLTKWLIISKAYVY